MAGNPTAPVAASSAAFRRSGCATNTPARTSWPTIQSVAQSAVSPRACTCAATDRSPGRPADRLALGQQPLPLGRVGQVHHPPGDRGLPRARRPRDDVQARVQIDLIVRAVQPEAGSTISLTAINIIDQQSLYLLSHCSFPYLPLIWQTKAGQRRSRHVEPSPMLGGLGFDPAVDRHE
jgi:hypothetical protein